MLDLLTWGNISAFLNSSFFSSLAGALTGAFAGATAAQRIADRSKRRDALLQEIRSVNAAIVVSMIACNAGLALRKQFVKDIHETYNKKRAELTEFHRKRATGEQSRDLPFEFEADFRTLQMPLVPVDVLRTQLQEKISVSGRPLALVAALAGSLSSLSEVIQKRTALIERFRSQGEAAMEQLPAFYFALPFGPGHVSTEFQDTVEALNSVTDDVIFFSELLGSDLMAHGTKVLDEYRRISKRSLEQIHNVDFSEAHAAGLMPESANYEDWLKAFPNPARIGAPADVSVSASLRQKRG